MTNRGSSHAFKILVILLISAVSMGALNLQGTLRYEGPRVSGQIIPLASAMEAQALEKDVGQGVCFKAKVKNSGNVDTTYLIVVHWREDGADAWESGGLADATLSPGEYETLAVGCVECTEAMMGRHFDVRFALYEHGTETLLDEKEIDRAWHVKETMVDGSIIDFWIE